MRRLANLLHYYRAWIRRASNGPQEVGDMKNLMLIGLLGIGLMAAPAAKAAPVSVGIAVGVGPAWVGPAPVCAYGYYNYYPYACAPYGYYGPQWFSGGVFVGAGPWFHGYHGRAFYGHPGYYGHAGSYARPGYYAHGAVRGGAVGRAPVANGFHGGGNVHGGNAFHGGHR